MKKVLSLCILLALVFVSSGCAGFARAPVVPPLGWLYNDTKAPMDVDFKATTLGKSGQATTQNVLGFVAWGDASTQTAAANGGISTIEHADYELFNVLGVYSKFTTTVYGR